MGPPLASAPPVLWVLASFTLLLGLWVLCVACRRKQASRPWAGLEGIETPADPTLLRQTHLCTLSTLDTGLHKLHHGPPSSQAPRPASMDLLQAHWLEGQKGTPKLPKAPLSLHQDLPKPLLVLPSTPTCPEVTYSNVGLASLPRASLAARPVAAEYACVRKLKGTENTEVLPSAQVDILYSRVNKPKRTGKGLKNESLGPEGLRSLPSPLPRGQDVDLLALENVYESIQELGRTSCSPPAGSVGLGGDSELSSLWPGEPGWKAEEGENPVDPGGCTWALKPPGALRTCLVMLKRGPGRRQVVTFRDVRLLGSPTRRLESMGPGEAGPPCCSAHSNRRLGGGRLRIQEGVGGRPSLSVRLTAQPQGHHVGHTSPGTEPGLPLPHVPYRW
ncbi:PREDICTED: lck-interacting transmembrane adapter 1 [Elephantulus edwardii]|uniref:lck-interacting transmembrane adapter 1 n=1 Tax=Elephantulus edwardii TaxID=28737 RepID=UPI0003F07A5A|nr:PREDICTED: lck-interacting transmembrane adapter 1 [Elephantulus edwardii]